jgi:hypothetical protein
MTLPEMVISSVQVAMSPDFLPGYSATSIVFQTTDRLP